MKPAKYFIIFALVLLFSDLSGLAQEKTTAKKDYNFTVKVNPLNALGGPFWVVFIPITGEYKVLFEAKLAKHISAQVGAAYIGPSVLVNLDKISTDTSKVTGISTNGFKVSGMVKYFLSRDLPAPKGFYLGPQISYAKAKIANKTLSSEYVGAEKFCINLCIGYQMITSGGFTLDIFTGMGYVTRKWDYQGKSSGDFDLGNNKTGVNIPLGFSFGYAF